MQDVGISQDMSTVTIQCLVERFQIALKEPAQELKTVLLLDYGTLLGLMGPAIEAPKLAQMEHQANTPTRVLVSVLAWYLCAAQTHR